MPVFDTHYMPPGADEHMAQIEAEEAEAERLQEAYDEMLEAKIDESLADVGNLAEFLALTNEADPETDELRRLLGEWLTYHLRQGAMTAEQNDARFMELGQLFWDRFHQVHRAFITKEEGPQIQQQLGITQ